MPAGPQQRAHLLIARDALAKFCALSSMDIFHFVHFAS